MRGIKTAICAPSIRLDLCIWSRGFSGTCRRASLTDDLQRLRPGRCQFCGERWFVAQTPTQAAAVAEGQYTYDPCKRDKKSVKFFSSANDVDARSVPDQLKGLTQAEELLIAKGSLVMRVYRLKGGQRGYGGHVVNLAQNIDDFVNNLLRHARELPIIVVWRQGGKGTSVEWRVYKFMLVSWGVVWNANNTLHPHHC